MQIYYKGVPTFMLEARINELKMDLRYPLAPEQQRYRTDLIAELEEEIHSRKAPIEEHARRAKMIDEAVAAGRGGVKNDEARQNILRLLEEMRDRCAETAKQFGTVSLNSFEDGQSHARQMAEMIEQAIRDLPIP